MGQKVRIAEALVESMNSSQVVRWLLSMIVWSYATCNCVPMCVIITIVKI